MVKTENISSVKKEPTIITGSSLSNGKHGNYIDPFPDELQNSENLQKASLKEIKKDDDEQETFKF